VVDAKQESDMKIAAFHDPVYNFTLHLLWEIDAKQLGEYVATNFPGEENVNEADDWWGCHLPFTQRADPPHEVHVVALREMSLAPEPLAVLTHELFHVTHDVLRGRGIKCKDSTVEAYTYLLDSLVRRCLEAFEAAK
jgi:hypothetical protein